MWRSMLAPGSGAQESLLTTRTTEPSLVLMATRVPGWRSTSMT
jgi:hypothetical protein